MRKTIAALTIAVLAGATLAVAATGRDGANIRTSRSTNTQPYDLKIWSDGTGAFVPQSGATVPFKVTQSLANRFFADVRAARANPGTPGRCMKSASFGTTTTVVWHDYTSVDLQCPPLTPAVAALAADVKAIAAKVNTSGAINRRIPLPREPRMAPKAPATPLQMNPTPSPEESPS